MHRATPIIRQRVSSITDITAYTYFLIWEYCFKQCSLWLYSTRILVLKNAQRRRGFKGLYLLITWMFWKISSIFFAKDYVLKVSRKWTSKPQDLQTHLKKKTTKGFKCSYVVSMNLIGSNCLLTLAHLNPLFL